MARPDSIARDGISERPLQGRVALGTPTQGFALGLEKRPYRPRADESRFFQASPKADRNETPFTESTLNGSFPLRGKVPKGRMRGRAVDGEDARIPSREQQLDVPPPPAPPPR
jgi:hypothetical protein